MLAAPSLHLTKCHSINLRTKEEKHKRTRNLIKKFMCIKEWWSEQWIRIVLLNAIKEWITILQTLSALDRQFFFLSFCVSDSKKIMQNLLDEGRMWNGIAQKVKRREINYSCVCGREWIVLKMLWGEWRGIAVRESKTSDEK